ncbi:MAG TPA: hypothetical protein VFE62_28770 [Gemmataceae bacterium]|nr:hypothetical protein [Gemmataceae bacterium]
MNCPRCQGLIAADDVSLEHLIAKCRSCQEVFRFSPSEIEAVSAGEPRYDAGAFTEQPPLDPLPDVDLRAPLSLRAPRPPSIEIEDWGPNRKLVKRWFNYSYIGTAMFCVFWDGFLIFWYSMAFFGDGPWLMILFPMLHLLAGVCITYSTIAGFFNRTEITLDGGLLTVWHGPIPWFGQMSTSAGAIEQLYCMEMPNHWNNRRNYQAPLVSVNALLASGKTVPVVRSLAREEALFIEQQLEEWLEIVPRRVPGQVD